MRRPGALEAVGKEDDDKREGKEKCAGEFAERGQAGQKTQAQRDRPTQPIAQGA